ncbi:UDP-3-O-(3-hydroxymyristoyl)glucosamine N-acyltransferase [Labilibaculum sp. A4]|uniref:UDP-3-O-acylglucosamine N-acyltransferase n=1 Tax=Labilibaculum euxinus TaxID=2686357 RepID=A0A425Y209_9BACT|nr:UDP-3-O-(3-hydroxymyristoyl)glucosamine N-acyltransferase [Labilibaculum euxinus]MDQ1772579.1 UDP-3-O-(3-hydroxymyristoyl)glucosamine N-acyltransferase [Labilibaculum euxinus]MUP37665.1 UDP-3-O-(3-hydroxymyristoyl)glucosamine N-acyltransferase [Labilibaculum euxinus]MVB06870.1 UDP-3-O-(3-hydroxymyristoyl)glucosamine N-acyltransferase [Labilibaculum euxinus]MWN78350.1 UDP-3-O-(3-hydroxymyristoyl)glucosamine N-acyltransferase [Labilibaculum euxinus]
MEFTAEDIAEFLNGEVDGNAKVKVTNVSRIEEGKPGTLSFLANPKYEHYIYSTQSSIVLVNKDFETEKEIETTLIRVDDAYQALAQLLEMYEQSKPQKTGIEEPSFVSKSSKLGEKIYIGAFAYIGSNVQIGNNVKIYPHCYVGDNVIIGDNTILNSGVKIYEGCKIGAECIFHSGVVIGGDGFGFAPSSANDYKKVPQVGNVVIEDHVEIGANTCVDRATMGSTIIRKGVKLDNLIQVAHNVEIDENTVIASQTGIAGSAKIGKNCMIGGQVGIVGHLSIADEVKIAAQSGIGRTIKKEGTVLQGSPAFDFGPYQKSYVLFKNLPKMREQIIELEKEIKRLKEE